MTSTSINTTDLTNRFSWKRVGSLYRFNRPYIGKEVLFYGIASTVFALMTLIPSGSLLQFMIFTTTWSIIPYMVYLAPLIFAKSGDSRIIERMFPALPSEKYIFYLSYVLIIIPIISYALPLLTSWLYIKIPTIQTEPLLSLSKIRFSMPVSMLILNILTSTAESLTCLYTVMKSRSSRIIKGIVSVFLVQFGIGLIGGIYGFIGAMQGGFENAYTKTADADYLSGIAFSNTLLKQMSDSPVTYTMLGLLTVYTAAMLWLTYKAINRTNL